METVKINSNQNIVEKHFKYTDLFNILFFPIKINKTIRPKANPDVNVVLTNYSFLSFVPYLTINNLPADFEDFKYIYIDAPLINAIGDTQYSLSISNSAKTKSLFSGNGYSAQIYYDETKQTITGDSYTESYCCTNNVLKNAYDFSIDKTSLLPYELRTSRQLFVQIPSYLLGNAMSVFKNTIEPKYSYAPGTAADTEVSVFDTVSKSKASNEQPFYGDKIPGKNDVSNVPLGGISSADKKFSTYSLLSVKTAIVPALQGLYDFYKANVTPDNWELWLKFDIQDEMLKEMKGHVWTEFLNYINNPLEKTAYNGIDMTRFDSSLTTNSEWLDKNPILLGDYNSVQKLYTINQNKSFYEDKLFSIYLSKEPMGI